MKNTFKIVFILSIILGAVLFGCSDNKNTDDYEIWYSVYEDCQTKGTTPILSGLGTYKTGKNVTIKAKSGAQISGRRTSGSGSFSSTYESGGYACADINDIHGDWTVSAHIPDYRVTVKSGIGGTVSGGGIVEKGSSTNISAKPSSGYSFDRWTLTSGSGNFANASSPSTSFKPNSNCTVTANFKKSEDGYYTVSYSIGTIWTSGGLEFTISAARSNINMPEKLPSTLYMTYTINVEYYTNEGQFRQELYASGNAYINAGSYYCNITHDKDIPSSDGNVEYSIQISGPASLSGYPVRYQQY